MDEWTHTFPEPVSIHSALHTLDAWSRAKIDNQSLPRSEWQDLDAIKGNQQNPCDEPLTEDPGRKTIYTGALKPQLVDYIQYATTDFLQAPITKF